MLLFQQTHQTIQYGNSWGDHPVCQGDAGPEAQQRHAEDLHTGLHSCHGWSDWRVAGDSIPAVCGGWIRRAANGGGGGGEEEGAGVAHLLGSTWACGNVSDSSDWDQGQISDDSWAEKLSQPLACLLKRLQQDSADTVNGHSGELNHCVQPVRYAHFCNSFLFLMKKQSVELWPKIQ